MSELNKRIRPTLPEHVVETGRELTLRSFERFFAGSMNVPGATELHGQFSNLPLQTQEFVRELVVKVVDETVFNTLLAFDYTEDISIIADSNERDDDLRVMFDGLADSYVDPEAAGESVTASIRGRCSTPGCPRTSIRRGWTSSQRKIGSSIPHARPPN